MKDTIRRRHISPTFYGSNTRKNDEKIFKAINLSGKKQVSIISLMFIASIIFIVAGVAVTHQKNPGKEKAVKSVSSLEIDPSPTPQPTEAFEPMVLSWRKYTNDVFNFAVDIPAIWKTQEYELTTGTVIAFSPDTLPCKTCTYIRDGYLSIKIFNQKNDPVSYAVFQQRMNGLGKKREYIQIQLDKRNGVYVSNTAAVENQGWVYEISLDKDQGTANAAESEIFQKILSSFKFTGLSFDN